MRLLRALGKLLGFGLLLVAVGAVSGLAWLRWDSYRPRADWFDARQGHLTTIAVEHGRTSFGQLTESLELRSDSGLSVAARLIRNESLDVPLPVLVILGGFQTGRDAGDLFGDVGHRAVISVDYPYAGPKKVRGLGGMLDAIGPARQAFLDTAPALSIVVDWLVQQPWADADRIVIVGASLGVPFAATAAARDTRIRGAMLVHGAADNRLWLEANLAGRVGPELLRYPLSVILWWMAYGPAHETSEHVAAIAPRPVLIVGARADERTPAGQSERLYEMAGEPKRLRWTEGGHIEPDRPDIIIALLRIADEEMAFLTGQTK